MSGVVHPLRKTKHNLKYGDEIRRPPPGTDIVVRGVVHMESVTLFFGAPKTGKSFLAMDLGLAIADPAIDEWMGQDIKAHGPVLYVACEGHGGYWKRFEAAGRTIPDDFAIMLERPALIRPLPRSHDWVANPDDVIEAMREVEDERGAPPVLVIIDTVFQSFGMGNVNESSQMMAYMGACRAITARGCAVILVHHATKTGESPNGSGALTGATDTVVRVEGGKGEHTWEISYAKDDAATDPRAFKLEVVSGILDSFGDEVTSCKVVDDPSGSPAPGAAGAKLSPELSLMLSLLSDVLVKAPRTPPGGLPLSVTVAAHIKDWQAEVFARSRPGQPNNTKFQAFKRGVASLQAKGRVAVQGDLVWPV